MRVYYEFDDLASPFENFWNSYLRGFVTRPRNDDISISRISNLYLTIYFRFHATPRRAKSGEWSSTKVVNYYLIDFNPVWYMLWFVFGFSNHKSSMVTRRTVSFRNQRCEHTSVKRFQRITSYNETTPSYMKRLAIGEFLDMELAAKRVANTRTARVISHIIYAPIAPRLLG